MTFQLNFYMSYIIPSESSSLNHFRLTFNHSGDLHNIIMGNYLQMPLNTILSGQNNILDKHCSTTINRPFLYSHD